MTRTWRLTINAVLSTFLIAGMSTLPSIRGSTAYAQSEGDTRTVQQELGTRTDHAADTSAAYDPTSGVTTVRRKQDTVRLYNERTETYRQVGNRTETRNRLEPVYETRTRKEQRQRQEIQQVARTGTRQETRQETRYRPVYETKTRQVARTGNRAETRYRTEYEPVYTTQAYQDQEAFTATDWRWETRTRYEWQWVTHHRTERVLRWYTSPGYWSGSWETGHLVYPDGTWGRRYVSRWVSGYRYSVWENVSTPYLACDLVAVPYQERVQTTSTAYRAVTRHRSVFSHWRPHTVSYTVQVPYTYDETERYQEPVYDSAGYRDVYGYTWVSEPYRNYELIYPGGYWGYVTRSKSVYKYAKLGREALMVPRQEAYQVPVTETVAYTYYEPVTVTVTYSVDVPYEVQTGYRNVPYQVVVPVYDWVANGSWQPKEQITRTQLVTVGRVGSAMLAAEAVNPAKAKSSTFLSDSGKGNATTELSGSKKRLVFKADEAVASVAKKAEVGGGASRDTSPAQLPPGQVVAAPGRHNATPAATPTPAPVSVRDHDAPPRGDGNGNDYRGNGTNGHDNAQPARFTRDHWLGTWTQGNYSVTFRRSSNGLDYSFAIRNRGSWNNVQGGSLGDDNTRFTDTIGGELGTGCQLTIERAGDAYRLRGSVDAFGTRYTMDNLRK